MEEGENINNSYTTNKPSDGGQHETNEKMKENEGHGHDGVFVVGSRHHINARVPRGMEIISGVWGQCQGQGTSICCCPGHNYIQSNGNVEMVGGEWGGGGW